MLHVLLICVLLSKGPEVPWEPPPSSDMAVRDSVQRRDEFRPHQWLALSAIRIYQGTVSRWQGDVCNFTPSCSEYSYQAIKRYGFFWGTLMAADRLERCNYVCWTYAPRYYDVRWVEGRGFKLYDPPPGLGTSPRRAGPLTYLKKF